MMDPEKFTFLFEGGYGFGKEFEDGLFGLVTNVAFEGESWAQKSAEFSPIVESTFADYAF